MNVTRRTMLVGTALIAACAHARGSSGHLRGLWRRAEGAFALGKFHEFGDGEFAFDYEMLRVGPVSGGGDQPLAIAPTLSGDGAPAAFLSLAAAKLTVGDRIYERSAVERLPFSARSGDVDLSAELAVPEGPGRGAVLMIYGSGPAPKEAFDLWAFWFLARGWSVIAYDKRGSGASGGDWRTSGLEELAGDARAVIAAAREKFPKGVRPLVSWGASQGGWILPQLASEGLIDGIIMHAGSAMRPAEQIIAAVEAELRAYGFPNEEIGRAKAYYALDTDVSRGTRAFEEVLAAYEKASAAGAEWLLAPPAAADAPERTMIRKMADFDPAPYWRRSRVPILAIFGGKDLIVPPEANAALFQSLLGARGDFRSVVLADANHLMFTAETGVRAEYPTRSLLHPGYFPAIAGWLADIA